MMDDNDLVGRDLFLRLGAGEKIQCFRVWDADLFVTARVEEGAKLLPPRIVTMHSAEEYAAQRSGK